MRLSHRMVVAAVISMPTLLSSQRVSAEALDEAEFRQLHQELQPGDEPWRTIPWKIALLDAQRTAAQEGKPIFVWAMDGHPLGCT